MVMGGDSCSNSCRFESHHRILDGHLLKLLCLHKKVKINATEAGDCPFRKTIDTSIEQYVCKC